jgi:hypothetical protein
VTFPKLVSRRIGRRVAVVGGAVALAVPVAAQAATSSDWSQYLYGPGHYSYNRTATAITAANAGGLHRAWTWSPPIQPGDTGVPKLNGSPTVVAGRAYIGASDGWLYAVAESTGKTVGSANLGYITACSSRHGISSTAAVAADPARGGAATVYVTAGARGGSASSGNYLWALDAATLKAVTAWAHNPVAVDTQSGSYAWASPTVTGGRVYVGIASSCDKPLVRGGVTSVNQGTGTIASRWWSVPATHTNGTPGNIGGSVWTTPAVDTTTGAVYATTGNADEDNLDGSGCNCAQPGLSYSIVRLDGSTLKANGHWTDGTAAANAASKQDEDFGGSPTVFQGNLSGKTTAFVGACNKDGRYYVVQRDKMSAGLTWKFQVGNAGGTGSGFDNCLSAAAFDPTTAQLVIGGNHTATNIDGRAYPGSLRGLSANTPVTNRVLWDNGLPCNVIGSPSLNGNGLVAAATYGSYSSTAGAYQRCDGTTGRNYGPGCNDTDGTPHVYVVDGRHPVANANGRPDAPVLWCAQVPMGDFAQPTFADGYLFVAAGSTGPGSATPQLSAYTP